MSLIIIIILLICGGMLMAAELYVPGGVLGILGFCLLACGIGGIYANYGFAAGIICTAVSLATIIGVFLAWLKFFPETGMGRRFLPQNNVRDWVGYDVQKNGLLGKNGVCHTPLRPCGTAIVDGRRIDVVTQGEFLQQGQEVEIIKIEGNRIVVAATSKTSI